MTFSLAQRLFGRSSANARVLAEHERQAQYARAWGAYYGSYPNPLPVSPRAGLPAEDNVKLNYARLVVDEGVHALFGQPPAIDLDPNPGDRTPAEAWLDACFAANGWEALLLKLATNGGVCGHAYVKLLPAQAPGRYPRLVNLSPEYVTVRTDPDDVETADGYTIEWTAPGEGQTPLHHRQVLIREGNHWRIIDEQAQGNSPWATISMGLWPHSWPPLHDCQNLAQANVYYGLPDLTPDLLDLVQSLNYIVSNLARITRHHAHPKTWGRGFKAADMKLAVNEVMVLPSENAELRNLELYGNMAFSHRTWDMLRQAIHQLGKIPEITSGNLENVGTLSGVALGILYGPFIARTETKRATYGPMLQSLAGHLLELGGHGADLRPTITWPSVGPTNEIERRQALLLEQQLGVSQDTLITKLGYNPATEKAKAPPQPEGQHAVDQGPER